MGNDFSGPEYEATLNVFREALPRSWWNIYQGCLTSGFDPRDSMILLQTYILSQGLHGPELPDAHGPDSDIPDL